MTRAAQFVVQFNWCSSVRGGRDGGGGRERGMGEGEGEGERERGRDRQRERERGGRECASGQQVAPRNGWRPSEWLIHSRSCQSGVPVIRRAWEFVAKGVVQGRVRQLPAQILLVVANMQVGTLRSEVLKGSM